MRREAALIPFIPPEIPSGETVPICRAGWRRRGHHRLACPFRPMAGGPPIHPPSERASSTAGLNMCSACARLPHHQSTPGGVYGFANPIGVRWVLCASGRTAQAAGVDGVLVVDYPPEESRQLIDLLKAKGINSIFLLAPTSEDSRMEQVGRMASGYIYYVSLKGVTGAAHLDLQQVTAKLPQIRSHIRLPIGVGFGIRDAQTAKAIAAISDAVVIGSRLVQESSLGPRPGARQSVGAARRHPSRHGRCVSQFSQYAIESRPRLRDRQTTGGRG